VRTLAERSATEIRMSGETIVRGAVVTTQTLTHARGTLGLGDKTIADYLNTMPGRV
jgi:hypothetical protein